VSIRLLNCQTRNPTRSCISRSTSQSHPLSDSISQRASLFTYHLVRAGYSPAPSPRLILITSKTLVSLPTNYDSSGLGSARRTVTSAELATDPTQLTSSRTCHRHVTRSPHSGLLIHHHSVSFISLAAYFHFSSSPFHPSYLFSCLILLVHLLLVYLSGSAITPSHLQRRPSVAIPSVHRLKLSHLWLHPHSIVQVGQTLSEALHTD
jgi:hypothetical protein